MDFLWSLWVACNGNSVLFLIYAFAAVFPALLGLACLAYAIGSLTEPAKLEREAEDA